MASGWELVIRGLKPSAPPPRAWAGGWGLSQSPAATEFISPSAMSLVETLHNGAQRASGLETHGGAAPRERMLPRRGGCSREGGSREEGGSRGEGGSGRPPDTPALCLSPISLLLSCVLDKKPVIGTVKWERGTAEQRSKTKFPIRCSEKYQVLCLNHKR